MSLTPTPSDCDDDYDIYADLPPLQLRESSEKLRSNETTSIEAVSSLQADLQALQKKVVSLNKSNENLQCNISVLYKTARAELQRKDHTIAELRRELDNVVFRRAKNTSARRKINATNVSEIVTSKEIQLEEEVKRVSIRNEKIMREDEENVSTESCKVPALVDNHAKPIIDACASNLNKGKELHTIRNHKKEISKVDLNQFSVEGDKSLSKPDETELLHDAEVSNVHHNPSTLQVRASSTAYKKMTITSKSPVSEDARTDKKEQEHSDKVKTSICSNPPSTQTDGGCTDPNIYCETYTKKVDAAKPSDRKGSVWSLLSCVDNSANVWPGACATNNVGDSSPDSNKENSSASDCGRRCDSKEKKGKEPPPNSFNTNYSYGGAPNDPVKGEEPVFLQARPIPSILNAVEQNIGDEKSVQNSVHMCQALNVSALSNNRDNVEQRTREANEDSHTQEKDGVLPEKNIIATVLEPVSSVCPPLPKEKPAPLPPLPTDSPPATPPKEYANTTTSTPQNTSTPFSLTKSSKALTYQETSMQLSNIEPFGITVSSRTSLGVEKKDVLEEFDLSPHIQFPFKSQRRVKSIMVLETVDNVPFSSSDKGSLSKEKNSLSEENLHHPPGSKRNSASLKPSAGHKKAVRKDEAPDYKHFPDSRSAVRPSHNSRHLSSVKWSAHTPERRSPSEVLNKKSCRIERVSHQDEIRIRIPDRRSRSLSPLRRSDRYDRRRREDYYSRPWDSRRINFNSCTGKEDQIKCPKSSTKMDYKKSPEALNSAKERRLTRAGAKLKSSIVKKDLDEKSSKKIAVQSCTDFVNSKGDLSLKQENKERERYSQPAPSNTNSSLHSCDLKKVTDVCNAAIESQKEDNVVPTVIVLKRRSRTFLKLEDSEALSDNSIANAVLVKQDTRKHNGQGTPISGSLSRNPLSGKLCQESPQISDPSVAFDITDTNESNPRISTPLYFRERVNKSDSRSGDDDFFSESEESSSGGSDVSYKPHYNRKRARKRESKQNCKKRALQK